MITYVSVMYGVSQRLGSFHVCFCLKGGMTMCAFCSALDSDGSRVDGSDIVSTIHGHERLFGLG